MGTPGIGHPESWTRSAAVMGQGGGEEAGWEWGWLGADRALFSEACDSLEMNEAQSPLCPQGPHSTVLSARPTSWLVTQLLRAPLPRYKVRWSKGRMHALCPAGARLCSKGARV